MSNDLNSFKKYFFDKIVHVHMDLDLANKFWIQLVSEFYKKPLLLKCDYESIFSCIQKTIILELCPLSELAHVYFIAKGNICHFHLGYRGILSILFKNKLIKNINTQIVFKDEEFKCKLGTDQTIIHEVNPNKKTNEIVFCYAIITLNNDNKIIEVTYKNDIESVKCLVRNKNVWQSFEGEMVKKITIRRAAKRIPHLDNNKLYREMLALDNDAYEINKNILNLEDKLNGDL